MIPAANPPQEVSSQGEESEVTVQPQSRKELRNIRKEFIRQDAETSLGCFAVGIMARDGGIDKEIGLKASPPSLWK